MYPVPLQLGQSSGCTPLPPSVLRPLLNGALANCAEIVLRYEIRTGAKRRNVAGFQQMGEQSH